MPDRVVCPACGHKNSRHRVTCKECRASLAQATRDRVESRNAHLDDTDGLGENQTEAKDPKTTDTEQFNPRRFILYLVYLAGVIFLPSQVITALAVFTGNQATLRLVNVVLIIGLMYLYFFFDYRMKEGSIDPDERSGYIRFVSKQLKESFLKWWLILATVFFILSLWVTPV
jgi:hypothetical protein